MRFTHQEFTLENIFVSREIAASVLSISVVTLDRLVRAGQIERVKAGRRVLFTRASLNRYAEHLERSSR